MLRTIYSAPGFSYSAFRRHGTTSSPVPPVSDLTTLPLQRDAYSASVAVPHLHLPEGQGTSPKSAESLVALLMSVAKTRQETVTLEKPVAHPWQDLDLH